MKNAIIYRFTADDLFEGSNPADLEGINQRASARRYGRLMEAALREAYPEAEITVCQGEGKTEFEGPGLDAGCLEDIRLLGERVWERGGWHVERRYGLQEFAAALNRPGDPWTVNRLSMARGRGKVPEPEEENASGPTWTHEQVQAFKEAAARKADESQTGLRSVGSAYDTAEGVATEYLIGALLQAGHAVELPVTGAVIVDGIEIPYKGWQGIAYAYDGDLTVTLGRIKEQFGAEE